MKKTVAFELTFEVNTEELEAIHGERMVEAFMESVRGWLCDEGKSLTLL